MRVPATQFRGQDSQELTRHYNLIKAKDINSRTISLYSDDRKVETSGNDQIWMSDDMTLMIPETMVNDLFQCTAARMNGDIIKLIKGQKTCEIDIQKNRVRTDDGWTEARIAEFDRHGNICLSVNYLADYFDYDYQGKVAIVMGSERYGIVKEWYNTDYVGISIPQLGKCDSLNVANASTILIYESRMKQTGKLKR